MPEEQLQQEIESPDKDLRCDKCGKILSLRKHRCGKAKKVYYFCETCLAVHRLEAGETEGYVVNVF